MGGGGGYTLCGGGYTIHLSYGVEEEVIQPEEEVIALLWFYCQPLVQILDLDSDLDQGLTIQTNPLKLQISNFLESEKYK